LIARNILGMLLAQVCYALNAWLQDLKLFALNAWLQDLKLFV
jgi:hypothetical protein